MAVVGFHKEKIERPKIFKITAPKFMNKNPFDSRAPPNSHLMMLHQWQQSTGGSSVLSGSQMQNSNLIAAAFA